MTFGSLFAGIGGFDLGLERAGMTCKWQVEIDDYATKVLQRHWPDVPRWRDIADFITDAEKLHGDAGSDNASGDSQGTIWGEVPEPRDGAGMQVNVICGGFPCQPVSVAGRRDGMADERWLWDSFREVISILKPRTVVAENVPGLLSANAGRAFGTILRDLAECGYDATWNVLPAGAFGLPHLRKRVFVVANAQGRIEGRGKQSQRRSDQRDANIARDGAKGLAGNAMRDGREQVEQQDQRREKEAGTVSTLDIDAASGRISDWRVIKPTIRRGDARLPHRVDRLRGLGNAVVPQVAEWIGRQIIESAQQ